MVDVQNSLECKICYLKFDGEASAPHCPKSFPACGHTICKTCIDDPSLLRENNNVSCPMCRTLCKKRMLAVNFSLIGGYSN